MRIALFSDIHGNTSGLRAILDHLHHLGGAHLLYSLEDMLGGGPGTDEENRLTHLYCVPQP